LEQELEARVVWTVERAAAPGEMPPPPDAGVDADEA